MRKKHGVGSFRDDIDNEKKRRKKPDSFVKLYTHCCHDRRRRRRQRRCRCHRSVHFSPPLRSSPNFSHKFISFRDIVNVKALNVNFPSQPHHKLSSAHISRIRIL